jgi:hypothetical protein
MQFNPCTITKTLSALALLFAPLLLEISAYSDEINVDDSDWAWWRGPNRNGIANTGQSPPAKWDNTTNVLWKQPIPGRGHGSPTVVGNRIFLATADEENEIQSVLCYERETGRQIWKTDIHKGGFTANVRGGHPRSSRAASTIASDGHRVFVNFINSNAVYTTALTHDGKQIWRQKVTDYIIHQGFGSSPAIYGPLVIVSADNKGGGAIKAFDRVTGDVIWTVKRAALPNYASPIILKVDGRDQLLFTGHDLISSFDPLTGNVNWEVKGSTTECVTSVVTDGTHLVTSGGYPDKHIAVVRADGSGETLWRNSTEVYVPSMVFHDGHIYGVTDRGTAFCFSVNSDTPLWEHRLREPFAASPVLVGEHIYATSNKGTTYIFKATPTAFELVAENTLPADQVEATPAICGNQIYMRVAQKTGTTRQEMLYCIGKAD